MPNTRLLHHLLTKITMNAKVLVATCPSAIFHPLQNATMDHHEFRAMFCSTREEEIGSEEVCQSTDYVFKKVYE